MHPPIHLAFIADESTVLPTRTALASLCANRAATSEYRVHVLCCGVSEAGKARLAAMACDGVAVETKSVPPREADGTPSAQCKLRLAELLPGLDKVLYLENDILILKDLAELYAADTGDALAAAVKDMSCLPDGAKPGDAGNGVLFDAGVLLLDLRRLRAAALPEPAPEFRPNVDDSVAVRDALNAAWSGRIASLPLKYNTLITVLGAFEAAAIAEYYDIGGTRKTKAELIGDAVILRLSAKFKPWQYRNAPLAELWRKYSPQTDLPAGRVSWKALHKELPAGYCDDAHLMLGSGTEVIVSLTSYPARIRSVSGVVRAMLGQTVLPDRILLWLSEDQFPNGEADLPRELCALTENTRFEVRWCEGDLRPHKKYFYTMREYPDAIVITTDDDIDYPPYTLEQLLESQRLHPKAVSARQTHLVAFRGDGTIAPYVDWLFDAKFTGIPSEALVAIGCAGILYPPHCMDPDELLDPDAIVPTCLDTDDMWLKVMEVRHGTPVVNATAAEAHRCLPDTQDCALWATNRTGRNDLQLHRILSRYDRCADGSSVTERIAAARKALEPLLMMSEELKTTVAENVFLTKQNKRLKEKEAEFRGSRSYRLAAKISSLANAARRIKSALLGR